MTQKEVIHVEKPEILGEISYEESGVIEASAGTGKTYTIERMVVDLLIEEGVSVTDVLVVTFTERATEELRTRVREMLKSILEADGEAECDPDSEYWTIGEHERDRLKNALLSFDQAPVFTIHGFCNRLLQEYAFQNHQLLEMDVVDAGELFDRVFPDVLRDTFAADDRHRPVLKAFLEENNVEKLRTRLRQATGTWETVRPSVSAEDLDTMREDLTRFVADFDEIDDRIQRALEAGEPHGNRTNKIQRILDAFREAVAAYQEDGTIWSFLGTLNRVSKNNDDPIDYFVNDMGDKDWMPGQVVEHLGLFAETKLGPVVVVINVFARLLEERLDRQKREEGLYTYDDMLELVRDGLMDSGSGDQLIQTIRSEYRYAVIDEFQDTDPRQWDIFRTLFFDSGSDNPCYLVGDPKQAIYGFRGADVRVYHQSRETVGNVHRLSTNFRSTPDLVEAYNRILTPDEEGRFFNEDGRNQYNEPVDAGFGDKWFGEPGSRRADPIVVKNVVAENTLYKSGYDRTLGREYAREIESLLDRDEPLHRSTDDGSDSDPIEAGDIFVLVRKVQEAQLMGRYLRARDIPHSFYRQEGLFETEEARDMVQVLRAVLEPGDRSRRLSAWTTPFFDVDLANVDRVDEVVDEDHELHRRLLQWNEWAREGQVSRMIQSMLTDSGVLRRSLYRFPGERAYTNYQQLGETLVQWSRGESLSVRELVRRLDRLRTGDEVPGIDGEDTMDMETEHSSVQIMTMHKAKGLQAPVVFLYGGLTASKRRPYTFYPQDESGRILYFGSISGPYRDQIEQYRRDEDERLMYVAMTRAEGRLYLPGVPEQSPNGPIGPVVDRLNDFSGTVKHPGEGSESPENLIRFDNVPADDRLPSVPVPVEPSEPESGDSTLPEPVRPDVEFGQLRGKRRLYTESYSSVSRSSRSEEDRTDESFTWGEKGPEREADPPEADLPPGRETGLFVHELLEEIDLKRLKRCMESDQGRERWTGNRDLNRRIQAGIEQYDLTEVPLESVHRILWETLTRTIAFNDICIPGLCSVDRVRREMEFWMPIPEKNHPETGRPVESDLLAEGPSFSVERGYLRGFIDLVFEWDGKVYAADWKTDSFSSIEDYHSEALADYVADHYRAQELFYSMALARLISRSDESVQDRFGGLFYFFVRGMAGGERPGDGVYFNQPSVQDLIDIKEEAERTIARQIRARQAVERRD